MIYDINNNNQLIASLSNSSSDSKFGNAVGVPGTNYIVTCNWNNILVLGEIFIN